MAVVTLLTDFGTSDSYVAEMKGVLLAHAPHATLVDITHAVAPGAVRSAAYLLGRTWSRFPAGTVHLVVVDPGVGTGRAALAIAAGGHRFVGPDNGVLTPALEAGPGALVALPVPASAAPTFHGRDLFAPAAARLALGAAPDELGVSPAAPPVRLPPAVVRLEEGEVVGEVLHVDHFGTLVTSLLAAEVPPGAEVWIDDLRVGPLRRTFSDVPPGAVLAFRGSGGEVEIAVRDGSAARRFGVGPGRPVRVRPA